MRVLLVTGKGGVGKTSVAAATALRAARSGLSTLVVSTDPAHSLADALDVEVGATPTPVAQRLEAEQVDAQRRLEERWHEVRSYLVALFAWGGVSEVEAEELAVLPGLEEILALVDLRVHLAAGRHDLLVVDCAPTAETLRLLSLPDVLGWYFDRVFPVGRGVARIVRPVLGRVTTMPLPQDRVLGSVEQLARDLEAVRGVLTDARRSSVRLVTNAEKVVVAESRRTFTALSLFGYAVDAVVVNRLLPEQVSDPFFATWKRRQAHHLNEVREGFAGVPVLTAPLLDDELVGLDALDRYGAALYGDTPPEAVLRDGAPLRVAQSEDGYTLSLALPFTRGRDVDAAVRGDELYLTVSGHRRAVLLPAALRRCDVAGATVREGVLEVAFLAREGSAA